MSQPASDSIENELRSARPSTARNGARNGGKEPQRTEPRDGWRGIFRVLHNRPQHCAVANDAYKCTVRQMSIELHVTGLHGNSRCSKCSWRWSMYSAILPCVLLEMATTVIASNLSITANCNINAMVLNRNSHFSGVFSKFSQHFQ